MSCAVVAIVMSRKVMGYSVKLAGSAAAIVVVSSFLQPLQEHSLISLSY